MNRPAILTGAIPGSQTFRFVRLPFVLLGLVLWAFSPKQVTAQESIEPTLMTEVQNTLNQVIVRWESNPETPLASYVLFRAPKGSDDWEEVLTCEYYGDKTFYAYRDQQIGAHDQIQYRLQAIDADGNQIKYAPVIAQLTPYNSRLSYAVDMEKQTISFFGGFLSPDSRVTLMDLQGGRFEFPTAFVDDRLTMDAIELPNGKYTYTVASGNKRRSGNVQFDRQLLEQVPGAFAFSPSKDE